MTQVHTLEEYLRTLEVSTADTPADRPRPNAARPAPHNQSGTAKSATVTSTTEHVSTSTRNLVSPRPACFSAYARQDLHPSIKTGRTVKVPDPPMLDDGKKPTFKEWVTKMRDKLLLEAARFPSDEHQIAYVSSRVKGDAARHVTSQRYHKSLSPYDSVEDIFTHLSSIFENPNREREARRQYKNLAMGEDQSFQAFISEFRLLASEGNISKASLKNDFWDRVTEPLRMATLHLLTDSKVTFDDLAATMALYNSDMNHNLTI
ncbi:uncharacterized protein N7483_008157 [Penicillium malachiteum]|uniref:uncharacterized protein n=1 Tax=Penicillium malachiteum TaxID=1324776 RepID=UPI002548690D|nr:uncharacterized protein N7483_008157 [Penicillium malachiteum]KAJ5720223.1 hypothetical protein N7483_008157 [Penicillium malachiteum]